METATIDLKRFCATEEHHRFQTQEPFSLGDGWLYATNGRVAVRVPSNDPAAEGRKLPKSIAEFAQWAAGESAALPIPDVMTLPFDPCSECGGKGKTPERRECSTCEGEGDVECDMGHYHPCEDCGGKGYCTIKGRVIDCPDCVNGRAIVEWCGATWGARLFRDIASLPTPVGKVIPRGETSAYLVGRFEAGGQFMLCSREKPTA